LTKYQIASNINNENQKKADTMGKFDKFKGELKSIFTDVVEDLTPEPFKPRRLSRAKVKQDPDLEIKEIDDKYDDHDIFEA